MTPISHFANFNDSWRKISTGLWFICSIFEIDNKSENLTTRKMKVFRLLILVLITAIASMATHAEVTVGAARTDVYLPLLQGKRIGLLSNHTGLVGDRHTLDVMIENGLNVTTLFSPEHGFRGKADAGEHVSGSVDKKTGLPIISLYGKRSRPTAEVMNELDVVVVDLQDVGLRFYTYYITMLNVIEVAADNDVDIVIFDRPNPNGMYIDGPILDMTLKSGVGRLPIPVVHGMTLGELALMSIGEKWLNCRKEPQLTVVECLGYTHNTRYELPVAPSPNLPNMTAIYLYPSMCLFEGTIMSLGRGTDWPFTIYGHPSMKGCNFSFTPQSRQGAKNPPLLGKKCYGRDIRNLNHEAIIANGINLDYVIDAYRNSGMKVHKAKFFTTFFDKLIGDRRTRRMIEQGASAKEIKAQWAKDINHFRIQRKPYLIYSE